MMDTDIKRLTDDVSERANQLKQSEQSLSDMKQVEDKLRKQLVESEENQKISKGELESNLT